MAGGAETPNIAAPPAIARLAAHSSFLSMADPLDSKMRF